MSHHPYAFTLPAEALTQPPFLIFSEQDGSSTVTPSTSSEFDEWLDDQFIDEDGERTRLWTDCRIDVEAEAHPQGTRLTAVVKFRRLCDATAYKLRWC